MSPREIEALANLLRPMLLDFVEEAARRVVPIIVEELTSAEADGMQRGCDYSTHRGEARPVGFGFRAWQKLAPTIPGAVRRGRYWAVARNDFDAWEASRSPQQPPPSAPEWSPDEARAAGGIRTSKGLR